MTTFAAAKIGETLTRPVLVGTIADNVAKNGNPYVKITMKDGESEIVATMFDITSGALEEHGVVPDTIADVTLTVNSFQGNTSFRVAAIHPTRDATLSLDDFVRVPPVKLAEMYAYITGRLRELAGGDEDSIAALALGILTDYQDQYMTSSAAVSVHHNLRGGLLYHSYRMVQTAEAVCGVYAILDRELMVAGAALHDIGKLWEYRTSPAGDAAFTRSGVLFGHLYMGASLIEEYADERSCDPERVSALVHMILSHHGTQEWGAVATPATAEALALHYIDSLDAKLYIAEQQYKKLAPGEFSDKRPMGIDSRIYKPEWVQDGE